MNDSMGETQHSVPAVYSNHVEVSFGPLGVRIAWGESPDGTKNDVHWHTAVYVPLQVFPSVATLFEDIKRKIDFQTSPQGRSN